MAERNVRPVAPGSDAKPRRRRGLIWLIFFAPGALLMWWQYMFPKAGEVFGSGRRVDNKFLQFLATMGIYATLLFMWMLLTGRLDGPQHRPAPVGSAPAVTQPATKP